MVEMTFATEPTCYDEPTGELVLRIRGSSRNGQVVRLRSGKCTIGSDSDCTLRLVAPGIQPVHCLVIRGPHATVVRSWATDTRLNGRRFDDAILQPGDLLGIGVFEFEVLSSDDSQLPSEPDDRSDQPARMRAAVSSGRQRVHRLVDALRDARKEIVRLQGSAPDGQANQEARHLQQELILQRREELQSLAASLQEQEKSLLEQSDLVKRTRMAFGTDDTLRHLHDKTDHPEQKAHGESVDLEAELCVRTAELDSRREEFQRERQLWEEHRCMAQREIEHRIERLEQDRETLEDQSRAFDKDFTDWQAACGRATDELRKRSEELDRCWQDLERQQRKHQTDHGAWDTPGDRKPEFGEDFSTTAMSPHAQSEEPRIEQTTPEVSLSSVDVCRDLGMPVDFAEEETIGRAEADVSLDSGSESHLSTVDDHEEEEDEESIEDYMAKLLGRVHASSSDSSSHTESVARHPIDTASDDQNGEQETTPVAKQETIPASVVEPLEQARHAQVLDPSSMEPRATAPEGDVNLGVIREPVDSATIAVINRDPTGRISKGAMRGLLVGLVGLVFGSIAMWAWSTQPSTTSFLILAVAGYTVAAYGTLRYVVSEARVISRKSHTQCDEQDAISR